MSSHTRREPDEVVSVFEVERLVVASENRGKKEVEVTLLSSRKEEDEVISAWQGGRRRWDEEAILISLWLGVVLFFCPGSRRGLNEKGEVDLDPCQAKALFLLRFLQVHWNEHDLVRHLLRNLC